MMIIIILFMFYDNPTNFCDLTKLYNVILVFDELIE